MYIDPNCIDKAGSRELLGQGGSQYFSHAINSKKPKSSSQKNKGSFGIDVRCLVTGNCFNESAVVTKEGILIYTVITDEPTDCILIGKRLFNRTLSEKFKLDTLSKMEFVTTLAHNCSWAPNAIMSLALCVWEETFPFGSYITTEGKEINSLYAIKSGVVKLSIDPSKDVPSEVLNLIRPPQNHLVDILSKSKQLTSEESEKQRKAHVQYHLSHLQHNVKKIRKSYPCMLKNKANICILGPGDFVGSTEALFSIKCSNFTAICDSPVTVYCLDHVNFQLWITKRYPFSAHHMHLVNRTILVEWTSRLRGAAILSCLLAMTNQELNRLQFNSGKRMVKIYGGVKDGYSPKQLALRIARSVTTFSWNQEEIAKLTKDAELTDSAFFSQPFTSSCLQATSSNSLPRRKDSTASRPFTAPSKLALESGIIISSWSLASVEKNRKLSQPCFDHPLSKLHKRTPQEAFTIPMPSPYLSVADQEQGVILEENCKLDDSVCTELSLSLEGIHDNSTSLTTVSSLPDNYPVSKVEFQDIHQTIANAVHHRGVVIINDASTIFVPPSATEDPMSGANVMDGSHHITHSIPPQWTTGYPATPANSPVKRSLSSAGGRYRVSPSMHTALSDNPITPVMEESLSSSSNETLLEEIELRNYAEDPKSQAEPNATVHQPHLPMQQFTFPQAGRPTSIRLHRYVVIIVL